MIDGRGDVHGRGGVLVEVDRAAEVSPYRGTCGAPPEVRVIAVGRRRWWLDGLFVAAMLGTVAAVAVGELANIVALAFASVWLGAMRTSYDRGHLCRIVSTPTPAASACAAPMPRSRSCSRLPIRARSIC